MEASRAEKNVCFSLEEKQIFSAKLAETGRSYVSELVVEKSTTDLLGWTDFGLAKLCETTDVFAAFFVEGREVPVKELRAPHHSDGSAIWCEGA